MQDGIDNGRVVSSVPWVDDLVRKPHRSGQLGDTDARAVNAPILHKIERRGVRDGVIVSVEQ
jgi:hypothetical protein